MRCGKSVHLVDGQEKQLRDATDFIQRLQLDHGTKPLGSIFTHGPSELASALSDSWLVVEVRPQVDVLEFADVVSVSRRRLT